jgi:uncharacterized protein (DUF1778 family)
MPRKGWKKPNPKDADVRFRVTPAELQVLQEAAKRAGKSLSEWLRGLALERARRTENDS